MKVTGSDVCQVSHDPELTTPVPMGKPVTPGLALPVFWSLGSIQSAHEEPKVLLLAADDVTLPEVALVVWL